MTAPELSPEEQRVVARFDAAPITVEHMTGVLLTAILGDTDGDLVLEGDLPASEIARLIAEVAAPAALAVFRGQQDPAVQRVLALADELAQVEGSPIDFGPRTIAARLRAALDAQ